VKIKITISSGKPKWSLPRSSAKCLVAAPDGNLLAGFVQQVNWGTAKNGKIVGKSGKRAVTVWDAANGQLKWQTDSARLVPSQLRFDTARKRLLGLNSSTLMSWELASGSLLDHTALATGSSRSRLTPRQLRLSTDGRSAGIVGFMGEQLELWDLRTVKQLAGMKFKFPNTLRHAVFLPDLDAVVCAQNHDPVILHLSWKTESGQP